MAKYVYPAIFTPVKNGYCISFPDFPDKMTEAENICEAMAQAERALSLILSDMEYENKAIPEATPIGSLKNEKNEIITMILCDTDKFRAETDCTLIEKTVAIPAYLVKFADKYDIDLSGALSTVLRQLYGHTEEPSFPDMIINLADDCDDDFDDENDEDLEDDLQTYYDFAFDGAVVCNITFKTPTNAYTATIICVNKDEIDEDRFKLIFDDALETIDDTVCKTYEDAIEHIRDCIESDYGCKTALICSDFAATFTCIDKDEECDTSEG